MQNPRYFFGGRGATVAQSHGGVKMWVQVPPSTPVNFSLSRTVVKPMAFGQCARIKNRIRGPSCTEFLLMKWGITT